MDIAQFDLPVRIVMEPGEPVTEIYSAEEAHDLLTAWPVKEGPVFERAIAACAAATGEQASCEKARRMFVSFARAAGILASDVPLSSLYENGELKPSYR